MIPIQMIVKQMMNSPQFRNNPMAGNVMKMLQNGDTNGIEQFGRNMARERGVDFDKAFEEFKQRFPMR